MINHDLNVSPLHVRVKLAPHLGSQLANMWKSIWFYNEQSQQEHGRFKLTLKLRLRRAGIDRMVLEPCSLEEKSIQKCVRKSGEWLELSIALNDTLQIFCNNVKVVEYGIECSKQLEIGIKGVRLDTNFGLYYAMYRPLGK